MSTEVITKKLFTVDEFQRMSDAGILPATCRHELIRGEIIEVTGPGSPHASRVKRLLRLFTSRLGEMVIVSVQDPVVLSRHSATLPDVALLRPRNDFYAEAHPGPEDILLLIEVADTTARWDSTVKADLYAESGIGEYWLLDINEDVLVIHTNPDNGRYQTVIKHRRSQSVSPQQLTAITLTIDEILG